ncbi:hypothetical protein K9B33_11525 [Sphingobium sp. 3R8]|uniref:hypothetical protein n=1 Tax=Sphingobium sp. 3R8 TaxID=2874921 RepID=UPI001CCA711A|nr:hypothetical protein [Sphingobium sp. 3R8]MBZ9648180.1 hypothetical protein [Sphingobium sp. 3R8]
MHEITTTLDGSNRRAVRRNPDWTRDETILLFDLYLRAPRAEKTHPEVIALSSVLRAAGRRDGRAVLPNFRNPSGIAMRLRNFRKHDPQVPPSQNAGLRPGGAIDARIWSEFGTDLAALAVEVSRIRRLISSEQWTVRDRSSRGPAPSFGRTVSISEDGRTGVYLLLLDGPLNLLAPGKILTAGWAVIKFGRTGNLERRMSELSGGLPPGATIRYLPLGLRMFGNGADAHTFERQMLDMCDRFGWSLGGEFAYAPLAQVRHALAECHGRKAKDMGHAKG